MAPIFKQQRLGKESEESDTPSNNLWVGNLSGETVDSDLMELFNKYGALDSVTTYSSRSYAFVFFKRVEDAKAAKDALQGVTLHGNQIKIEFARPVRFVVLLFSVSLGFSSQFRVIIYVYILKETEDKWMFYVFQILLYIFCTVFHILFVPLT